MDDYAAVERSDNKEQRTVVVLLRGRRNVGADTQMDPKHKLDECTLASSHVMTFVNKALKLLERHKRKKVQEVNYLIRGSTILWLKSSGH